MTVLGDITQVDLSGTEIFLSKEKFSEAGIRFALELSALSYNLNIRPWVDAGWSDITIKIRDRLFHSIDTSDSDSLIQSLYNSIAPYFGKKTKHKKIKKRKKIKKQIVTPYKAEYGRAIIMSKEIADCKFAIAITFAGTGRNLTSWLSNFDFAHEDGIHAGFKKLTDTFFAQVNNIEFPSIAEKLGFESLALRDILLSVKNDNSPFLVFVSGHSQGAALLQLFIYNLLMQEVKRKNILGYGFAAPTTVSNNFEQIDMPINLINFENDVFTRLGIQKHIGNVYLFQADDMLKAACYGDLAEDTMFQNAISYLLSIKNTEESLFSTLAFTYALSYLPAKMQSGVFEGGFSLLRILPSDDTSTSISLMRAFLRDRYVLLTGHEPDKQSLLNKAKEYLILMNKFGAKKLMEANMTAIRASHSLRLDEKGELISCYAYIALKGFEKLKKIN
jgi:hypothetical protein